VTTMITKYKFKCPSCGHDVLEEIVTNAVVSSAVDSLIYDTEKNQTYIDYCDNEINDYGDTDRFQCKNCGMPVLDNDGKKITFYGDLDKGAGITPVKNDK